VTPTLLIEAIVRQTMVLIGQLATSAGIRAPLSRVADQVFLELVRELEQQGVRQKVVADMFGLALRTYQKKVQRLSQSSTFLGRTLWEAIYDRLADAKMMTRNELLQAFASDDDATVRGILRDMVESGLIFESGAGPRTTYRVATPEDLDRMVAGDQGADQAMFVWASIYRLGPVTFDALRQAISMDGVKLRRLVEELVSEGRVQTDAADGERSAATLFSAAQFIVPLEARTGWAAAVFDHYQAVVHTILAKLNGDDPDLPYPGRTGGSTWTFDIWPGHQHEDDVLGLLADIRARVIAVQERVFAVNAESPRPAHHARVSFYLGQSVKHLRAEATDQGTPA